MNWLAEWIQNPDHQLHLLMAVIFLIMWVLGEFIGVTREDYEGYWSQNDVDDELD